jgi:hypothetical protein
MFGKVLCLYLVLLLAVITVNFYTWLSGLNIKTLDIGREIQLGLFGLLFLATLFNFCNYAHNFANIVRHQKVLFKDIYDAFILC